MDLFTQILENFNIKDYDQLLPDEQETLRGWVDQVEKATVTLEDVKRGMAAIREGLEQELVKIDNLGRRDLHLKARLKNIIILEAILTRPEKARAALDQYISQAKMKTRT